MKPKFFDSHAHLVADDQNRYPRNPMQRAADAPYRPPGVIGRPGGHHGLNPINEVPDTSRMLEWMKEENVVGAVAVQKRMIYRYDNSYILDSSKQYPDIFSAVVILDAEDASTPDLVRSYVKDYDLVGLRLFGGRKPDGSMPWLNSQNALRTWEAVDDSRIVMDLEVLSQGGGGPSIPTILELAEQYKNTKIVLDHLLEPEMDQGDNFGLDHRYEKMAGHERIYFKFTSINLDICRESGVSAARLLRRAVDMFGADKIMWGSDIGTSSGTYADMVQRMIDASSLLNEEEKQKVWHDSGLTAFTKK